jgi:ribosomal protein L17
MRELDEAVELLEEANRLVIHAKPNDLTALRAQQETIKAVGLLAIEVSRLVRAIEATEDILTRTLSGSNRRAGFWERILKEK